MFNKKIIPFISDFDHLFYIRVFEGCNLYCEHCFIPKNPKIMKLEQIDDAINKIGSIVKEKQTIIIQWHGGEPTLMGVDWLSSAIEKINNAALIGNYTVIHGIQTNLMNYSEDWKNFYIKYFDSNIGISWDPKIRLLSKNNFETNIKYEIKFFDNLKKLINDKIEPYIVVTATKIFFDTFKNPLDFFIFMEEHGINKIHIERLTRTGYAFENWNKLGVTNKEYSIYMSKLMKAYILYKKINNDSKISVSPFDGIIASIDNFKNNKIGGYGCWSGKCDTRFHTIDQNGYKYGCTALTSEIDNKNSRNKLNFDNNYVNLRENRVRVNCKDCIYKNICSSGCLSVAFDDGSGECSGGKILFETGEFIYNNEYQGDNLNE